MEIRKSIADQMSILNTDATIYLLGAKDDDSVFSIAVALKGEGGCPDYIPEISSTQLSKEVVNLAKAGYTRFSLCWTPCIQGKENFEIIANNVYAALGKSQFNKYRETVVGNHLTYFHKLNIDLPVCTLHSGVFMYHDGYKILPGNIV